MLGLKLTNMINFHPLEAVCGGSQTRLQASENLKLIWRFNASMGFGKDNSYKTLLSTNVIDI